MAKFEKNSRVRFQSLPRVVVATDQKGKKYALSPEMVLECAERFDVSTCVIDVVPNSGREQEYLVQFVGDGPGDGIIVYRATFGEGCLTGVSH